MIFAIEGPDCSGKTTLFNVLRGCVQATFVPSLPLAPPLLPLMHLVEQRHLALWDHVYDAERMYIMDRCPWVSAPVFDRLFGRLTTKVGDVWLERVCVVYLVASLDVLVARRTVRGDDVIADDQLERLVELYEARVELFPHIRLNANRPVAELALETLRYIHGSQRLGIVP